MILPFEIWLHIASYIPTDHLKTLYAVNHAFFVISMDEQYKTIDLTKSMSNDDHITIPMTIARLRYFSLFIAFLHPYLL
jgi:hypothetical protein